jgi:hypothetical protein
MPTPHEVMQAQKQRLLDEASQVDHDMRELERIISKYDLTVVAVPSDVHAIDRPRGIFAAASLESVDIIRSMGHPVVISELLRILTVERGHNLVTRDPVRVLAGALAGNPKLQYLKDFGWWIRGIPWPPTAEDMAELLGGADNKQKAWPWEKPGSGPPTHGPSRSPDRQKLFVTVRSVLSGRTDPMKFGELFDLVKERGAKVGGTNERQNFAVFLSKFSCFATEGRQKGWSYIRERDFELQDAPKPGQVDDLWK